MKRTLSFLLVAVGIAGVFLWFGSRRGIRADVEIVTDTFSRTVTSGWGSADSGQAYTTTGGNATDYNVTGGHGTILHNVASTSREAALTTVSITDSISLLKLKFDKTPAGANQEVQVIARRVASNTNYRVRLIFSSSGNVGLFATKVVSGSTTNLSSQVNISLTPDADKYFWYKAEVVGTSPTTIRSKVWEDGQSEPASWQYTTTDSQSELQVASAIGVRTNVVAGSSVVPVTFSFDSFSVTDTSISPSPTPSPTPSPSPSPSPSPEPSFAPTSAPMNPAPVPGCTESAPGGAPELFQIDRIGTRAKLYFAPPGGSYNSYYIGYGMEDLTEQFGVEFPYPQTTGAVVYTIQHLDPATAYSFKVRGGNGCQPGDWSQALKIFPVTAAEAAEVVIFYR